MQWLRSIRVPALLLSLSTRDHGLVIVLRAPLVVKSVMVVILLMVLHVMMTSRCHNSRTTWRTLIIVLLMVSPCAVHYSVHVLLLLSIGPVIVLTRRVLMVIGLLKREVSLIMGMVVWR